MGFKADTSFLKFLTMGARGVHHTMTRLSEVGFSPIELERYCGSNKIWATKVKRLRLPDLLCIRTGLRVEVKAKSDLKIRMSDAPTKPDRVWDAGLRNKDLVAFVACKDTDQGPAPFDTPSFFTAEALRNSASSSRLGPPKSASEGAERDRIWPATIPARDGKVIQVTSEKIVTQMFATSGQGARNQTFTLNGKTAYVRPGDTFEAGSRFLSGTPASMATVADYLSQDYDPISGLHSNNAVDRYAGVKALRSRDDIAKKRRLPELENLIRKESEQRVRLEAAGSAVVLASSLGQDVIKDFLWKEDTAPEMRMEAVLILTELGPGGFTRDQLQKVASAERFAGNEIRQAAVWGLGKGGLRAYEDLLEFLDDREENVVLHAIAAFGQDTPPRVIERLIEKLLLLDKTVSPAASAALRLIGSDAVLQSLTLAYQQNPRAKNWILATLGRMSPTLVRSKLQGQSILKKVEPMLLVAPGANWLSSEEMAINVSFLLKQNI
ncbi:MAG: HEAT repeat domain-containing protein [Proteobacteria bacterium]|nr:HEAT repeat domain-containing protein [Pseudomonadota bacterium]